MNVVDLEDVRQRRAHVEQTVQAYVENMALFLVNTAVAQAERAFSVSGPIAGADFEMALIINRGVLRKLRSQIRKRVPATLGEDTRRAFIEQAERVFGGRMMALIDEREKVQR